MSVPLRAGTEWHCIQGSMQFGWRPAPCPAEWQGKEGELDSGPSLMGQENVDEGGWTIQDPKSPQISKKMVSTKIVHTSGTLLGIFGEKLNKVSTNHFKPCSYLQSNTQIPNPIFKITIYCTKYTKNAKILSNIWKIGNFLKKHKNIDFLILLYV